MTSTLVSLHYFWFGKFYFSVVLLYCMLCKLDLQGRWESKKKRYKLRIRQGELQCQIYLHSDLCCSEELNNIFNCSVLSVCQDKKAYKDR